MIKEKINSLVKKKTSGDNKKNLENLITFLVLLIITVIAINIIWGKENNNEKQSPAEENYKVLAYNKNESNNTQDNEYNLEEKLENILSKISGVGKAQVLITYSETSSVIAMRNEKKNSSKTEENDSEGGTRRIESIDENKEIIVDSNNNPITEELVAIFVILSTCLNTSCFGPKPLIAIE